MTIVVREALDEVKVDVSFSTEKRNPCFGIHQDRSKSGHCMNRGSMLGKEDVGVVPFPPDDGYSVYPCKLSIYTTVPNTSETIN